MALIECSECGQMVSENAKSCPKCGNPIKSNKGFGWKKPILSIVVLLLVLGGVYAAWQLIGSNGKDKDIEITYALSKSVHRYDGLTSFHEGFAAVIKNGKWGYINSDGEEVIPCKYEGASPFSEGLACVYVSENDMSVEFIDRKGNVVIKGFYGYAMQGGTYYAPLSFSNGKCFVFDKEENEIWIDKDGNVVDEPQIVDEDFESDGTVKFEVDDKVGIKDSLGNVLVGAKYSFIDNFSQGLALAYLYCGDKTIFGYVDKKGNDTFTKEDFELFSSYREKKQQEAKRVEEERKRQEEELRRQGREVLITMSADTHDDYLRNKQCNIGDISDRWDQMISKRLVVSEGKVLTFKNVEIIYDRSNPANWLSLDFVRIFVYDKDGYQRGIYEAKSCGEFSIFEGERVQALIHLNVGHGDNHLEIAFHFREKDKDQY